jgi:hypothetical protein
MPWPLEIKLVSKLKKYCKYQIRNKILWELNQDG